MSGFLFFRGFIFQFGSVLKIINLEQDIFRFFCFFGVLYFNLVLCSRS
jgi:hypothetical protein